MIQGFKELDRILRGQATMLPALRAGRMDVNLGRLMITLMLLGVIYGFFMGWFAVLNRPEHDAQPVQILASMVKVPLLFVLTLIVTFPSLYVFNALVGSGLTIASLAQLLMAAIAVMLAVLASFGPIIAFFALTSARTTSYPFMLLLNVLVFTVSGILGLIFLLRTLQRLSIVIDEQRISLDAPAAPEAKTESPDESPEAHEPTVQPPASPPGAIDALEGHVLGHHVKAVFRIWVIVFGVVGGQMAWVMRPFIGSPDLHFQWFRAREGNFFEAVWNTFIKLFE